MNHSFNATAGYYARTSTEDQREKQTIQSQVAALEVELQKRGDLLVEKYIDDGFSGAILDRPALDKLRADAKQRLFKKLYIYSPDRLARELMLQLLIVKELRKYGIEVIFLSQQFGDSPADQLLFQMLGAISEFERAQILERTRRGKLYKARLGILLGSVAKFGYDYVKKTDTAPGRYEVNTENAKSVNLIFNLYKSANISGMRSLAKELYRRGVRNYSGNTKWARSTLAKLLRDTTYIGTAYFNKSIGCEPVKARQKRRHQSKTSRRLRPKEEWIPIPVPAIIDRELFNAAQDKLASNSVLSKRNSKYPYLLKGLIFCDCGKRMYGYPCHEKPRYKCSDKYLSFPLSRTCKNGTKDSATLDNRIWKTFMRTLNQPDLVATRMNNLRTQKAQLKNEFETRINDIDAKIAVLNNQDERLVQAYTERVLTLSQLKSQIDDLSRKKQILMTEKSRLTIDHVGDVPIPTYEDVSRYFRIINKKAQGASFELRQKVIRLFADRIIVGANKVLVRAYISNPIPNELPFSDSAASTEIVVSTKAPPSGYDGPSRCYRFDIEIDLNDPDKINITDRLAA
jgi:site-specific DNA recombinase